MIETEKKCQCFFCEKDLQETIYHTDLSKAFYDTFPVSKGHTLIVPRRHVADYHDMTRAERIDLWECEEVVKKILEDLYHPDGFNIGINCGLAAGQSIFHVHLHVIPRYFGDMENPKGGVRGVIPSKQRY